MAFTITVPDDVRRQLARPGGDVALRLVLDAGATPGPGTEAPVVGPPGGPLAPLMASGELVPGDRLYWNRPRLGKRHVATVLPNGELDVDGVRYRSPSDAASACASSNANGWTAWRRERDGKLIDRLR